MVPWGGQALPIVYRFRPNGNDPDSHIMEIMFLFAKAADGTHPEPAGMRLLEPEPGLERRPRTSGSAAMVADQDTDNLITDPGRPQNLTQAGGDAGAVSGKPDPALSRNAGCLSGALGGCDQRRPA